MIQTLEVNIAALELLPETDPLGPNDAQLKCKVSKIEICRFGTCNKPVSTCDITVGVF